jgi:hypothetical protein
MDQSQPNMRCSDVAKRRAFTGAAIIATIILVACGLTTSESALRRTVEAFSNAAAECLVDVRDRDLDYERSANCLALGRLSRSYIDAGGLTDSTPAEFEKVAESARATAWSALAISKTKDKTLSLW